VEEHGRSEEQQEVGGLSQGVRALGLGGG
jgi:hypothetical protein